MSGPGYHGRTHLPGGTDPITFPGPASAIADVGGASKSLTGNDLLSFTHLYATPGTYYAPDTDDPSDFQFINLLIEGFYMADFSFFWFSNFTTGQNPKIEPACQIGGTPDSLVQSALVYWDNTQGSLVGEQMDAGEFAHSQVTARVLFNYTVADLDADFGIGVRLLSSFSGSKTIGGTVVVTRLSDALEEVT